MYFLGDTHGVRSAMHAIDKKKLDTTTIIHVGDLGLGFQSITNDIRDLCALDEFCQQSGINFYAIRGNHDNPIFWKQEFGLRLPKFYNIHLVDDYSIINIESKNILCVGGAISIDRLIRASEHPPTWWRNERFYLDFEKLNLTLSKINTIDIVVTHSAPDFAFPQNDHVAIVDHYCDLEQKHGLDLRKDLRQERADIGDLYGEIIKAGFKPEKYMN
jgi:DNA repair exonuclease SbcCD nuclease subunit